MLTTEHVENGEVGEFGSTVEHVKRTGVFFGIRDDASSFSLPRCFSRLKAKAGLVFAKFATLLITLNVDGSPTSSRSHTHPTHSQTSRLLTSSLSLGIPVPHGTQCIPDVLFPLFYLLVFHNTDTLG